MKKQYRCKICKLTETNIKGILNHSCFEENIEVSKDGENWTQYSWCD
tara:strand:- start:706 stop:846 length:141 start_codon:yes stop_codon:yes gene_type:complete